MIEYGRVAADQALPLGVEHAPGGIESPEHQAAIGKRPKLQDRIGARGPDLWCAAAGLGPDNDWVQPGLLESSGGVEPVSVCGPSDLGEIPIIDLARIGGVKKA
jgi:hypothetical protein